MDNREITPGYVCFIAVMRPVSQTQGIEVGMAPCAEAADTGESRDLFWPGDCTEQVPWLPIRQRGKSDTDFEFEFGVMLFGKE